MPGTVTLVVCTTCRLPGADPAAPRDGARLSDALTAQGVPHRQQACLSACARGCAVALCAPGKFTYVQGGLDPERDIPDLLAYATDYARAPDGIVPWRSRPEVIRKNTIARIPPLEA
ncbi:DUF1636 family protein [Paenirhodobacter sp.]|uniref:DUF1636 family protein n=1 Tax=Paenirhodobacter sp. TaxID=1965326 RepID=UPI003B3F48E7